MKPIDVQNAVILVLQRAPGRPDQVVTNLRAASVMVTHAEVGRALERLRVDGLAEITGSDVRPGNVCLPIYSLTDAGRAEAAQLPEGK